MINVKENPAGAAIFLEQQITQLVQNSIDAGVALQKPKDTKAVKSVIDQININTTNIKLIIKKEPTFINVLFKKDQAARAALSNILDQYDRMVKLLDNVITKQKDKKFINEASTYFRDISQKITPEFAKLHKFYKKLWYNGTDSIFAQPSVTELVPSGGNIIKKTPFLKTLATKIIPNILRRL